MRTTKIGPDLRLALSPSSFTHQLEGDLKELMTLSLFKKSRGMKAL